MKSEQPQCRECNHPYSFHPKGDYCCAGGCKCKAWVEPKK